MQEEESKPPDENASCNVYLPKRYVLIVLGFWGIFNTFAMRVILSEAIVAMVNHTHPISFNSSLNQSSECSEIQNKHFPLQSEEFKGEKYNWDSGTQGAILGSYYYGYVITQLPGGILAERFGAKWVFGCGVLATAIFCLISPLAASWGTVAFIAIRVLQGAADGLTIPAMNCAISTWSPKTERSRFSTLVFSGVMVGTVVGMPVSGVLCSTDFLGGWPSAFYVFGFVSCIWFAFWCFFIYETPSHHPSISQEELFYIEQNRDDLPEKEKRATPWKSILTSLPAWAVLVSHTGHNFGFLIMLTEIPTYLSTVLHFNLMSNGFLSALPFICETISAFAASFLADGLRKSNAMSITAIRKLLNSIGMFGPGFCLVGIAFSGCNSDIIIALLCVGMALNGGIYSGFNVTHVDMCPTNPGTLYAITNAVSNLTGIIGPWIVSAFTENGATRANWSKVFFTTAAMYIFCGGFYAIFGSAELQEWDPSARVPESEDTQKDNTKQKDQKTKL